MELYSHHFLSKQTSFFFRITYSPQVSPPTRATVTLYHFMLLAQTKMTEDINDYHGSGPQGHFSEKNFRSVSYFVVAKRPRTDTQTNIFTRENRNILDQLLVSCGL